MTMDGVGGDASSDALLTYRPHERGLIGHSIGVRDGRIAWIASDDRLPTFSRETEIVEGDGKLLTPGLIDCHTHLVYGGNRASEWEQRLTGVSYEDIARQGGGILSTVAATRKVSVDELVWSAAKRLARLQSEGVTTIEIKSGYGLDMATELKMLEAAGRLGEQFDVTVVSTLLAAHATPPEFKGDSDRYIDYVCREMIPAAKGRCSAVDAFCEKIAFSVEQTERVFEAALDCGLKIKVHADQLSHTGIVPIAARMGALSADHLEYLSEGDCESISSSNIVATLLPGAFYCLREKQRPPVEALRKHGVPIAVATDCNPGSSPLTSLLLAANMACNCFGLTPSEALAAITVHAAKALGMSDEVGSLKAGLFADFAIWDVNSPAEIIYGIGHNPCVAVYRRGRRV